jgi:hypothetical protein
VARVADGERPPLVGEPDEDEGDEHAVRIVAAQLDVGRREHVGRLRSRPGRGGGEEPQQGLRPRHEQRGRRALVRDVGHRDVEGAGRREDVVEVAAHLPRGLQAREDLDGHVGRRVGEARRHHAELDLARRRELALELYQVRERLVAQALLLEARADPRLEQGRVDRLGEVVLGAQLDAADHALHLVERGDHDHGQAHEAPLAAQPLEDLIAVQLRHHDVEQHEVEGLGAQDLEGLGAVGGHRQVAITEALETSREHVPVVGVVVDDEEREGVVAHGLARAE